MSVDMSEYLVVGIFRAGNNGADFLGSVRCNRKETADFIVRLIEENASGPGGEKPAWCSVEIFHDPPKIGQGAL